MKYIAARLLSVTGIAKLARHILARKGRFVLVMHGILKQRYPDLTSEVQSGFTVTEMDQIIQWVKQRFQLLTPVQFLRTDDPGVLLSFDDGHANQYLNALPVLERHEAPAVFFVSTQHVLEPRNWLLVTAQRAQTQWPDVEAVPDRWAWELCNGMTPDQVTACGRHPLITIGSHTVSHPFLTRCEPARLAYELSASRQQLEAMTGQTVDWFAYPSGDYDRRVAEAVRAAGYKWAFALMPKGVGLPQYEVPRMDISFPYPYYLDAKLSGLYQRPVSALALSVG